MIFRQGYNERYQFSRPVQGMLSDNVKPGRWNNSTVLHKPGKNEISGKTGGIVHGNRFLELLTKNRQKDELAMLDLQSKDILNSLIGFPNEEAKRLIEPG